MRIHSSFSGIYLVLLMLLANVAKADWINLTGAEASPNIAEITVADDHVKIALEIYVGDLEVFRDLIPDHLLRDGGEGRLPLKQRLKRFSKYGFQVITGEGERLQARLAIVEPRTRVDRNSPFAGMLNPLTLQRVPAPPEDNRVLYAELIYPFEAKPMRLTFVPPNDEEGRASVNIGFIAYHKVVPIIDFRYLGTAANLNLDWDDPWYTHFDSPNLKRHHNSAMMSFLYVEPYEVRHEILARVKDLEEWMDLDLRGEEFIEADELESLKQRIGEFMLDKNPVLIDGFAQRPILDRTNFVKVSLDGIQIIEEPDRLEIATAIVGIIISYITDGIPQEVTVDWVLFTDQLQRVPTTATDPAGPLQTYVTPEDSRHIWTNYLKNYRLPTVEQMPVQETLGKFSIPIGTILGMGFLVPIALLMARRQRRGQPVLAVMTLGGLVILGAVAAYPYFKFAADRPAMLAGSLDEVQAKQLLTTLLKNIYRAFDFREEQDVYDKLALSVDGDLLADIYLQNRRSFAIQQAGGAQAKIKEVQVDQAVPKRLEDSTLGYAIKGRWTAMGSVGHWGHTHIRRNLYEAIVRVEAVGGNWKITDLNLLEEKRIDPNAALPQEARSAN
jgi:hypothetical protein